ncbi:Ternary complex factor MIP1, leucine-zipper [Quillaja saponaria]|uniref:Ternary complex factor MIP1, leucine-zipper n=1 Tax=Quillaja saponaria TaxID=32244 RepID=A0AAD7M099_QUISA|nr:Ternary complex factor MIP1, leucine-zipper [Quillaja saponaria]KAJ7967368.1 Ternary complex factor MIP1, leucine-zipper [Quillaja saponaria]
MRSIVEASYCPKMEERPLKRNVESKKRQSHNIDLQSTLTEEILQLQKRYKEQVVLRCALEKAYYRPFSHDATLETSIPKAAKELVKEIAVLELEVLYLEKYILSLYRKRFNQQILPVSTKDGILRLSSANNCKGMCKIPGNGTILEKESSVVYSGHLISPWNSIGSPPKECNDKLELDNLFDSSIHRSHSTLSQRSAFSGRTSPMKTLTKAVDTYHSLPLSMLKEAQRAERSSVSLGEYLACSFGNVQETPNWLSEEMIKCISALYCELADPIHDNSSSPIAFSSSVYESSSLGDHQRRGSQCKKFSSFNSHFHNPFHIKRSKEFSGPYCSMVKIQQLRRDGEKLKEVGYMLRRFRSLVPRLEEVDTRNLNHEEKLAFWINVHNTLVMHAFLVYGVPLNNFRRMALVLKAAYNVGGHTVSVNTIQNSILGCRMPRPGQWLWLFFSSKTKVKVGDARKAYAIHHPEPLLHFALCSGSHSDPVVRLYTPKRILEELETAKEEYIESTFSVNREQKILLPKTVEAFAKDSGMCPSDLLEMIECYIPDSQKKIIQSKKNWKSIEWIPHDFTFHYLLSKELCW